MNPNVSLMNQFSETDELKIFDTDILQQMIKFKWEKYGMRHHLFGCVMHLFYTFIFTVYVANAYIKESQNNLVYACLLALGILYPLLYDIHQFVKMGVIEYFSQFWNYIDIMYISGSMLNLTLQLYLSPYNIFCRILMCIITLALLVKTFFFLRIFPIFTPIVVMIMEVVYDLRIFMIFFFILLGFTSQLFAVLGLGNNYDIVDYWPTGDKYEPARDWKSIGLHMGQFFWNFRTTLGDFSQIVASKNLNEIDNWMFWVIWIMTVVLTCVIFLNFVVCEASASYSRVVESLEQIQIQSRTVLIAESEQMSFKRFKNCDKNPKYLIVRSID